MITEQTYVRRFVLYAGSCLSVFTVSSLTGYPTLDARTTDRPGLSALSALRELNPLKRFCRASPNRSVKRTVMFLCRRSYLRHCFTGIGTVPKIRLAISAHHAEPFVSSSILQFVSRDIGTNASCRF